MASKEEKKEIARVRVDELVEAFQAFDVDDCRENLKEALEAALRFSIAYNEWTGDIAGDRDPPAQHDVIDAEWWEVTH